MMQNSNIQCNNSTILTRLDIKITLSVSALSDKHASVDICCISRGEKLTHLLFHEVAFTLNSDFG